MTTTETIMNKTQSIRTRSLTSVRTLLVVLAVLAGQVLAASTASATTRTGALDLVRDDTSTQLASCLSNQENIHVGGGIVLCGGFVADTSDSRAIGCRSDQENVRVAHGIVLCGGFVLDTGDDATASCLSNQENVRVTAGIVLCGGFVAIERDTAVARCLSNQENIAVDGVVVLCGGFVAETSHTATRCLSTQEGLVIEGVVVCGSFVLRTHDPLRAIQRCPADRYGDRGQVVVAGDLVVCGVTSTTLAGGR